MFAETIFPADAASDLIAAITGMLSQNIATILIVLGFALGLGLVLALFNNAKHGKVSTGGSTSLGSWGSSFQSGIAAGLSQKDAAIYADRNRPGNG